MVEEFDQHNHKHNDSYCFTMMQGYAYDNYSNCEQSNVEITTENLLQYNVGDVFVEFVINEICCDERHHESNHEDTQRNTF